MTKACTSVFTDSTSSERRTRLSWRSQKKHIAHTLETCLSRLRSDNIVTPRTWSLAATVSVPSCSDGPPLPNGVCPYLEPTQTRPDQLCCAIVRFNFPLDTLCVILGTILWVTRPNQQCHSTEGQWLVNQIKGQSYQAHLTKR